MKFFAFRGFFVACFALFAAVMTMSTPSAAASYEPALHVLHLGSFDVDHVAVIPAVAVSERQASIAASSARRQVDLGRHHPVYGLSLRTDGQSLGVAHRMLC